MVRKKTLWKVPVFCVVAGIIAYYLIVSILGRFAVVTLPDGSISINSTKSLLISGVLLLAALLAGKWFLRGMTCKELFFSASIVVLYGLILLLVQWAFQLTTGPAAVWLVYLFRPFEWCSAVGQALFKLTDHLWLSSMLEMFSPYLLIVLGKKQA